MYTEEDKISKYFEDEQKIIMWEDTVEGINEEQEI